MKIRCLVADDEPLALKLISEYVSRIPHLELIGVCKRATDISAFIGRIDLLFLDIRMPGLSGLELLRSMPVRPIVILITAYSEHAVEGFELDVEDYLVKPVTFERFLQAVNKATMQYELTHRHSYPEDHPVEPVEEKEAQGKDYFFVKSGFKSVRINFSEILFIEGLREYVSIHTADRKFIRLAALKDLEQTLPAGKFIRIHKSYIVAVDKVTAFYGNTVEINQHSLPVGRIYKEETVKIFS